MRSEIHSKQKIFIIIWIIISVFIGVFVGNIYSTTWDEYQDPWLVSEKLPTSEDYQVQIPPSSFEYILRIVLYDNVSMDSQTEIQASYIAGSIQVFFNNEIEVVYTDSGVPRDIGDEVPLYAPAAINLEYPFTNPTNPLSVRINVSDASASVQPIWWVRIYRNDHPEVLFIQGLLIGCGISIFVGLVICFLLFR